MTRWYLQPIFDSYPLVIAAGVVLFALLALRPSFGDLSLRGRLSLIALRTGTVLLLLVAMLQPFCVRTTTRRQTAVIAVMIDVTRSMRQPLESAGKSRFEAELEAVRRMQVELARMGPAFEITCFSYDTAAHPLEFDGKTANWPQSADGLQTDIGSSLAEVTARQRGKRLGAVFLLGDGVQTAYAPKVETTEAARELARLGSPLYTTAFGPARDEVQAKDVAIASLPEQFTVFVNTELSVKALVQVRGYALQDLPVELVLEDAGGKREVVSRQTVRAKEDGQQVPVEFQYQPRTVGQYQLTVRAAEQPGEATTINNHMSAYLNVMEGGLRVLYLAGELWGEQMRLRRAVESSPDMHLDFVWIDHRNRSRWPVASLAETLTKGGYDVLILENVDALALGEENLGLLAAQVEQGKSLLMIGGAHSFGPGGYAQTKLGELLPVEMDKIERQQYGEAMRSDVHWPGPIPLAPAQAGDPITTLGKSGDAGAIWKKLPPLEGANKFARLKPRAKVLLSGPKGEPLLVAGEAVGRVLAFAGDTTWKWWGQGFQKEHKQFWRQVILWLAHRQDEEKTDVWLRLDMRRLNLGQKLTYAAGVRSSTSEPVSGAEFKAVLTAPDGGETPLALTASGVERKGAFDGFKAPGRHQLSVTASKDGKVLGSSRKELEVVDVNPEETILSADPDHFARLSAFTREQGGQLVPPEQLVEVLRELQRKPPDTEEEILEKWQLAQGWTDAFGVLLLLVGLLSCEWYLRKRWGLV